MGNIRLTTMSPEDRIFVLQALQNGVVTTAEARYLLTYEIEGRKS